MAVLERFSVVCETLFSDTEPCGELHTHAAICFSVGVNVNFPQGLVQLRSHPAKLLAVWCGTIAYVSETRSHVITVVLVFRSHLRVT